MGFLAAIAPLLRVRAESRPSSAWREELRARGACGLAYCAAVAGDGVTTATILFTDIVGSTEMRTRLGDGEADELRRAHDRAVAGAVEDHGGEVVKGLGDGAMAVFPSAADAVRAGAAVQQGIDALNRTADEGHAFGVRVGLGAGDVVWEDGDCHGTPVVVAARLCDAAEGGQVLCDDLVRGLARRRATQEFREVGDRELKGLDEPVFTYDVAWAPLLVGHAPLPSPLAMVPGEFPFAGREEERDRLAGLWKAAQADGRTVVLVSGEPGQGKTRLASELARAAHAEGAWILLGRCDERIAAPYAPWLEVLHHVVAHADEQILQDHVDRQGGELTRLVPELGGRVEGVEPPRDLDPETERLVLYDAVTDLLVGVSGVAPLMVVVDDAHWADGASVDLLGRLITHLPADAAVLLVVTYRDTDIDRVHPLARAIADLRREPRVERIALRGMTTDELESLLAAAGGQDLDEIGQAFAANLARETEGNPFFVGEILRHLVDSGMLVQEDGRWQGTVTVDEVGIPEGIRDVIGRRLTRLSEAVNDTLRTAAVVGREFDVGLVAQVTDQSEDVVLDHVEEALEARVLDEVADQFGRLSFSHALMRSTLIEELSTVRRVRLHARIGDALEATGAASSAEHKALSRKNVRAVKDMFGTKRIYRYGRSRWILESEHVTKRSSPFNDAVLFLSTSGKRHLLLARHYVEAFDLQSVEALHNSGCVRDTAKEVYLMTMWRGSDVTEVQELFDRGLLKPKRKR